jgi:hypothetical protein
MTRSEEYRSRAADCDRRALLTPASRLDLQARARAWRQLAHDAEALERITADQAAQQRSEPHLGRD